MIFLQFSMIYYEEFTVIQCWESGSDWIRNIFLDSELIVSDADPIKITDTEKR